MSEQEYQELIDWLERLERDIHRVQVVLMATMGCVAGLVIVTVLGMM